eukprot:Tbor_TRINITY_DN2219_c0_g1::TRINITY_DN2219_c0_g1_i1::g.2762::m.2762/K13719/OTU1, YOD1; ubiquitin thioesterase OTU1
MLPKELFIRVRIPHAKDIKTISIEEDTPLGLLLFMLESESQIPVEKIKLFSGFPPKEVSREDESVLVTSILKNGDIVIVQDGTAEVKRGVTAGKYIPPSSTKSYFVRREMPRDNSCLFHAAAYVLKNKKRDHAHYMRAECAEAVAANRDYFTTDLLGQRNENYVRWISQPTSWGGQIELIILSFLYQVEIVSLDLQSTRVDRIGQDKNYTTRVFVVYTGDHYDAIASTPGAGGLERDDQVMFSATDQRVFDQAIQFVRSNGNS